MNTSSCPRTPSRLSDSVQHQLNMYALAASAAGVGILALAQPAEAKIVYTPAYVTFGIDKGSYYLDLNHDGINDFKFKFGPLFSTTGGYRSGSRLAVLSSVASNAVAGKSGFYGAFRLKRGALIGSAKQPFSGTLMAEVCCSGAKYWGYWINLWSNAPFTGYLGLKFQIEGQTHYGWARLSVQYFWKGSSFTTALTGYAYETIPNKPIIAGKEHGADDSREQPATLGRLALGRK